MSNNVPPIIRKRNEFGLLENVDYVFNDDGSINWRKMIKPEFLVPNKQYFEKVNKPLPTSIEGLEDRELLILLGGIKDLAQLRGYKRVSHVITAPSDSVVVSACHITFNPNYETENLAVDFCAVGDATPLNTNGFGKQFLGPIAENRAFVRCVRSFLRINIVSQDELPQGKGFQQEESLDTAGEVLKETMEQYAVTFEKIKETLMKDKFQGHEEINSISDIPKFKQFELVERIKKAVGTVKKK